MSLVAADVRRLTLNANRNGASSRRLLRMRMAVPGWRAALQSVAMSVSVAVLLACGGCCISRATHPQPLPGGEQRQWSGAASDKPIMLTVFRPVNVLTNMPLPVVFYLQNLAAPRVGTEPDADILRAFNAAGYLVVTVDFAGRTNARIPFINRDLGKLRDDIFKRKLLADLNLDTARIFIVPAGCRLQRDVVFYREEGRMLRMDIIYPSKPKQPVGAVLEFSCDNQDRFGNFSLSVCSDTLLDGFATEGFAVAMADHPVPPPYKGFDAMPDCALKIKAAVRTLRVEGEKLGMNGRIAPVGFSRGSGMALMLVTTAGLEQFEGAGENAGVSSDVQGAVVMSGRFTYLDLLPDDKMLPRYAKAWGERDQSLEVWRQHGALDYLKKPGGYPLFLTINCTESPDALHQMDVLQKRLKELGGKFEFHLDNEPRGHKVTLDPQILDAMRDYLRQSLGRPAPGD
jgi:dienelactone hydrolase